MADTLLYASDEPERIATEAIRPVPALGSLRMGFGSDAATIIKILVAIHIMMVGIIDFLGLKNDADIDITGAATKRAFCDMKCALGYPLHA